MTLYELDVRSEDPEGVTLVELAGELDLTNAREVERRLEPVAGGTTGLALDLNRVTFVDSAALHMLFRLARRFDHGRRFTIVVEPTALVARTLAIVGLHEVANVRSSLEDQVVERTT